MAGEVFAYLAKPVYSREKSRREEDLQLQTWMTTFAAEVPWQREKASWEPFLVSLDLVVTHHTCYPGESLVVLEVGGRQEGFLGELQRAFLVIVLDERKHCHLLMMACLQLNCKKFRYLILL